VVRTGKSKKSIQNFDGENFWEKLTWYNKKEVGGNWYE
jgi:hypothetical protein